MLVVVLNVINLIFRAFGCEKISEKKSSSASTGQMLLLALLNY